MAVRINTKSPGTRLQIGTSVLSAAREVDTRLVKDRLQRFEDAHRSYVAAQRKVDAADAELEAAQARLAKLDDTQDHAVELLARALVNHGQPRGNPFAAFGAPAPGQLARRAFGEEADAVQKLVTAIMRSNGMSKDTIEAAQAADKAARGVKQALAPIAELEGKVRDARRKRDAIGQVWESALAALRRGTKAAADEGAPDLHATLFPSAVRGGGKSKAAEKAPESPPQPSAVTPNAA